MSSKFLSLVRGAPGRGVDGVANGVCLGERRKISSPAQSESDPRPKTI